MTHRKTYSKCEHFNGPLTLTTTPAGRELGWTKKITESTAQSTFAVTSAGMVLTLGAANESKIATIYQNDILTFLINKVRRVEFTMNIANFSNVSELVAGLASAQNDTADSVATLAWFRMQGSVDTGLVVVETDDGTNDNDDKATAVSLSSTNKRFVIDFSNGLKDVRFLIDGQPVATGVTFDMSNVSSTQNVQLFFQLQKASGTAQPALTIRDIEISGICAD